MRRTVAGVCAILMMLIAGCGKIAEPFHLPANEEVTAISIITQDGTTIENLQAEAIEQIMAALKNASPTSKQSVNDQPTNGESFGKVSIDAGGETTVLYYYDEDGKHYIEQPYAGIYELENSFEELLPKKNMSGKLKAYSEMRDGTWSCDGFSYKYRLEISGRMPNAAKESTFVYLSNIEEITFEQAWKAAGLSSDSNDYFSPEEAVLVEMK